MRRILSVFSRDILSSRRDFILAYMVIAPILLAVGLKFFIPGVESAALQFAIHEKLGKEVIAEFERYGKVEVYSTVERIEERVGTIDDIAGITRNEAGTYRVILEGNESHDTKEMAYMIIRDMTADGSLDVRFEVTDIGYRLSPVAGIGSASLILTAIIIGGMVIGFNMIEEKQSETMKALNVTPLTRLEFIAGKSMIGFLLPLVQVYVMLWILGLLNVNKAMILVMTVVSSMIAVIVGFLVGLMSSNQISGIANMKILFLIPSTSIIGAILLPADKHFLLYWSPFYWSFIGFREIITAAAVWRQVGVYACWILGLTLIAFLIMRGRIRKGLV